MRNLTGRGERLSGCRALLEKDSEEFVVYRCFISPPGGYEAILNQRQGQLKKWALSLSSNVGGEIKEIVGASLLAMVVNDNAYLLAKRGALESIVGTPPGASSLLH